MTRRILLLTALAASLVPATAAGAELPHVAHGERAYTNDFPALLTVDAVMTRNALSARWDFVLACTGTQPDLQTTIECWVDTPDFTLIREGSGPGAATVVVRGFTTLEPEDVRFCVLLVGKPFPPECAVPLR